MSARTPVRTRRFGGKRKPQRAFYRALALLVVALTAAIVVLALLVTTSGPRVRHALVQKGPGGEVSVVDGGLTLVFDRPVVAAGDVSRAFEVRPRTDHTVTHRGGRISVAFRENLRSNAEYTVSLAPGALRDDLGKPMSGGYSFRFTTPEPSFTYLERNYGEGEPDRIVEKAALSGESRALFEAERIKSFARAGGRLLVAVPREGSPDRATDELRLVDLDRGGEGEPVRVPGEVQVDELASSPTGAQFAFVTRTLPEAGTTGPEAKAYGNRLYLLEVLEGGASLRAANTLSDAGNVASLLYSNDGQALLYRTLDGSHYLTGAPGDARAEPTLLGSYGVEGGFDRTNTKLVFQSGEGVVGIYDAKTRRLRELPGLGRGARISAPTFLHNSDELLYREDLFDPSTGELLFRVNVADQSGRAAPLAEVKPPTAFLDEPQASPDDRYVLVEATFDSLGLDDYAGNPQPKDSRLVIYDRQERKALDASTRGMDPAWNR